MPSKNKTRAATFAALDTETVNREGRGEACYLGVWREGRVQFIEPKEGDDFAGIFDFLAQRPAPKYVAWNADFDARALIHPNFLPWRVVESLGIDGRAKWRRWRFKFISSKFLEVREAKRGGRGFILFDLSQFYGMGLDSAARKVLGSDHGKDKIPKAWYNEMDRALCDERRAEILRYAARDIELCQRLVDHLMSSLVSFGLAPKRLSSCASLARLKFGPALEKCRPPDYLNSYFQRAFYGGRIECAVLGRVTNVKLYDLCSAYPAEMAELPDPSTGFSRQLAEGDEPGRGVDYGAYFLTAEIPLNWQFGPLAVRHENRVIFPVGFVRTWAGADAVRLLRRLKVKFRILRGLEISGCNPDPVLSEIPGLYARRKDSTIGLAVKLSLNSGYGLTAEATNYLRESVDASREIHGRPMETKTKFGALTNFLMAARITERVRLKVFDVCHAYPDAVKFAATDGLLVSNSVDLPTAKKLGAWDLKGEYDEAVILGCGRYYLLGKDGVEFHLRGFPVRDEIFAALMDCRSPRASIETLETASLRQWAVDTFADSLNVLRPAFRVLEVKDEKRHWPKILPWISSYFSDTISSRPYIMGDPDELKRLARRN